MVPAIEKLRHGSYFVCLDHRAAVQEDGGSCDAAIADNGDGLGLRKRGGVSAEKILCKFCINELFRRMISAVQEADGLCVAGGGFPALKCPCIGMVIRRVVAGGGFPALKCPC